MSEWIEWKGGRKEPPLRCLDIVQVQLRYGHIPPQNFAQTFSWEHRGNRNDIIAYRIIKEGEE